MTTPSSLITGGFQPASPSALVSGGFQAPSAAAGGVRPEATDTLMHTFEFSEEERSAITLVGDIRLDPDRHVVELKPDAAGNFPTTGTHYVIGHRVNPRAMRRWLVFQAKVNHARGIDQITGDGFRLFDGTNQWYWNGATWTQSTSQWSTEADIADHILDFPAASKTLAPVVRLTTTDRRVTPQLMWVKVAYSARIPSFLEDLMLRSLAGYLRAVRSTTDFSFKQRVTGANVDVGFAIDGAGIPFNVVDVEAIYNHATDPDHDEQLLLSYNPTTRQAVVTSSIPANTRLFLRAVIAPEVAVSATSSDYVEVEKVPSIAITDIDEVNSSPLNQDDGVTNKRTGYTIRVRAPYRMDVRFTMILSAPSAVDLRRMIDDIMGHIEQHPFVYSTAMDRPYRIWLVEEFTSRSKPNGADLHTSVATFMIKDVLAFKRPAIAEQAVTRAPQFRSQLTSTEE